MLNLWKRKPALGIGIGVSLVGAVALAARYGFRRAPRERIPDDISPAIFATRVTETIFGEMIYHISGSGDPSCFCTASISGPLRTNGRKYIRTLPWAGKSSFPI